MSDSMVSDTMLNTDELAFGSSSHHSAKHSVKSSYLRDSTLVKPQPRHS